MKPILFNTEMVKALLDGRKTVTRRLVKPQPSKKASWLDKCAGVYTFSDATFPHEPYSSGDILYVRETWGIAGFNPESNEMFVEYKADGANANIVLPEEKFQKYYEGMSEAEPDWHPSIHMPREAARIFLRVTDVRVERLQDIECIATEGIAMVPADDKRDPRYYFAKLWDSTIKTDVHLYDWHANPWVWVIEFERISKEDALNA